MSTYSTLQLHKYLFCEVTIGKDDINAGTMVFLQLSLTGINTTVDIYLIRKIKHQQLFEPVL